MGTAYAGNIISTDQVEEPVTCMWTTQDLALLRKSVGEMEQKQCRLRAQLQQALSKSERQDREQKRLKEELQEREQELARARQQAAQQGVLLEMLQHQLHQKDMCMETCVRETKASVAESQMAREKLEKLQEEVRELRREKEILVCEKDKLKQQLQVQGETVCVEQQEVLQGLHTQLQQAQAELDEERKGHQNSRTALELLQRHFSSQSQGVVVCQQLGRITYTK